MPRFFATLLLCFVLLPFAACDSNSDGDGNGNGNGNGGSTIGSSNVTVSGAFSDSFSGNAAFGVGEDGSSFSLALFEGNLTAGGTTSGGLVGIGRNEGRPGEGTFQITASGSAMDFAAAYISDFSNTTGGMFVGSATGTLTITSSTSGRVAGSFTFTGQAASTSGPLGEVTVQGTFTADLASTIPSTGFP
ncbi:MAG: hypothetical protein ABJF88_18125 [Rhodothermales bacterium]